MAYYTDNITWNLPTRYAKYDVDSKISMYDADQTPLLRLLTKLNKRKCTDTTIRWWETDLVEKWALVHASATAATDTTGDTTIYMDSSSDAQYCDPGGAHGALLFNPKTGEQMLCTAVSTAASPAFITVTRAYSDDTTAIGTVAVSTKLLRIGTIDYENRLSHTPLLVQPQEKTNYTEIFRDPISFSGTELELMFYTGDDRMHQIKKKGIEHAVDIERSLWLSRKYVGASAESRAMGGIKEFMSTTNQTSITASLTESHIESWMTTVFRYTPNNGRNLFLFGGGKFMQAINNFGREKLQTVSGADNPYGISFTRYISAQGEVRLVRHWLLQGPDTSNAELDRFAYAINLDLVSYNYLGSRDTKLKMNIQENDRDGEKHEYLTEATLKFKLPKSHGTLTSTVDFI